jgi:polysaccharide biosynthesis transport protein
MTSPEAHELSTQRRLRELLNMLRRQRWIVLGCVLVGLATGVLIALTRHAAYEASVVLRVDEKRLGLPTLEARLPFATGNQIGAELEVLRSRALAEMVVDNLRLQLQLAEPRGVPRSAAFTQITVSADAPAGEYRLVTTADDRVEVHDLVTRQPIGVFATHEPIRLRLATVLAATRATRPAEVVVRITPREETTAILREALKIRQPDRESGVIHISYASSDPQLVRDVPNELARHFVELRQRTYQAETRGTIAFLRSQLDTIAVQLAATESELQTFRERAQVVDPQAERISQIGRLAEMQANRDVLEAERSALADLVAAVRVENGNPDGPSPFRNLVAFPALLRNQASAELIRSLVDVEDQRAALITRRKPTDPEMLSLDSRIGDLELSLEGMVTTYLSGLTNQVQAVDGQLRQYTGALAGIPAKELQFARLARQVKLQEEIYGHLQARLTEAEVVHAVEDLSVRIIDSAAVELQPVALKRSLIVLFATMFGVLAGVGIGITREYFDDTVHSRHDLVLATGLPVLGMIPQIRRGDGAQSVPLARRLLGRDVGNRAPLPVRVEPYRPELIIDAAAARPLISEAYQRLYMNMLHGGSDTAIHSVLFTSALPGEGKTTTAINFAAALARKGNRVILVDADLRRATLSRRLHAQEDAGLADLLSPSPPPADEVVRKLDLGNGLTLSYIGAGPARRDPGEILDRKRISAFVAWARSEFDVVVFDTPPAAVASDAVFLSAWVDGVIFVARASVTPSEAVTDAIAEFRRANVPVLGTVLNDIRMTRDATYDSAYKWYGYGESYYSAPRPAAAAANGARGDAADARR